MRFCLIDRIVRLEAGTRLEAVKSLAMAEEYLADHFPAAPVMPGVMMLESLVQASAWLIRASEAFAHSVVVLKEARSVKYASFVEPGSVLRITTEITGQDERLTKLKAQATVDESMAVSARLVLERFNLRETDPAAEAVDVFLKTRLRDMYSVLTRELAKT
jgi:3-hydroxyacyl-[acyl-carrier-protein] dehydratase